jgi:DedD protein
MENRLKERLTGAAILVALIVLLVPEMFHGQRSDVAAPASSGDGPPIRSYTIDLSNSPASTAPLQSTPPATAAADGASEPTPASMSAAPPAAAAPAASAAVQVPNSGAAAVPKAPLKPLPPPSAPSATVAVAGARAASAGWSVQLGLFAQHDNAERLAHTAQAKGFSASVSDKDAKGLYHVQIGNVTDHAAAVALQGRLHDQGIAAAVVPPR